MRHLSLPPGPLKIVCLAAHPDDIEIAAGATLLALAERGAVEGHWLTLTGSPERRVEAEAAAEAFLPGSQSSFHAFPDGRLPAHWNEVKDILHAFAARPTQTRTWSSPQEWTTLIKTIDCSARWLRQSGGMLWYFTTRFRSGTATSGDPIATCRSRQSWGSARSRC